MAKGVIVTPGAQPTVPAATVNKFSFEKKRKIHCSICHQDGHNAATCRKKKST